MWGFESSIPSHLAHSSSGPGHRPLKAEIAGSNPACATTMLQARAPRPGFAVPFGGDGTTDTHTYDAM